MEGEVTWAELPLLESPHVHMKDKDVVLKKIRKIVRDGSNHLQFVTDFDHTCTRHHQEGKNTYSSYGVFEQSTQLPEKYFEVVDLWYTKYRHLEIDPKLSHDEKAKSIDEYNQLNHRALKGMNFDPSQIDALAKEYGGPMRDRTIEVFEKLRKDEIPVLVFSAGVGNIVEAILRQHGLMTENVHLIANFLKFNGSICEGFKNEHNILHAFNKNQHVVEKEFSHFWKGRPNVILMGDVIGDAHMADGIKTNEEILKIGYLYPYNEDRLSLFKDTFDITLVDDQSMDVVLSILELL